MRLSFVGSSLVAAALGLGLAFPAEAADPGGVRSALGRLEADVAAFRGVELAQAQLDPSRLAALGARALQLEEQLRQLTGRVEELEHAQRTTDQRLDRLVADLDARLRAGDTGDAAAAQAEPAPTQPVPAPVVAPTPVAPPPRPGATVGAQPQDPAAARGYVLGTLPRDAIVGDRSTLPPATSGQTQTAGTPSVTAPPRNAGPKLRYDAALAMLQAGDLSNAQTEFTSFVQDYPDDPLAPNAAYWLAETHYVQKDYQTAAALFARNYRTYGTDASKASDNLLKLGMSLAALGDNDKACQSYAELEKRYPNAAAPVRQQLARSKTASSCR